MAKNVILKKIKLFKGIGISRVNIFENSESGVQILKHLAPNKDQIEHVWTEEEI